MKSGRYRLAVCVAAALAVLATGVATPLTAQQRGDTENSTSSVVFTTSGQSVWGPGSEITLDPWEYSVFTWGWDDDLSASETESWNGLKLGGGLDLETAGNLGLKVGMDGITSGELSVRYPVGATVTFPAANSFRDGEPITIHTAWSLGSGGEIDAGAPNLRVYMAAPFSASGSIDAEICVLSCYSESIFSLNTGNTETTIFGAQPGRIEIADQSVDVDRWEFTFVEKFLLGISGSVEVPNKYPSSTSRSGNRLTASRNQQWTDVNWDLDQLLANMKVTPPIGGGVNLSDNVIIGYNLYDFDLNLDFFQSRSFAIEGQPGVDVIFPEAVEWWVTDGAGQEVGRGNSTTASLVVGNDLHLFFPSDHKSPMAAGTSYTLPNQFTSSGSFRFAGNLADTLLSARLKVPSVDGRKWLKTGTRDVWNFSCDRDTYGDVVCDIAAALGTAGRAVSDFWDKVVEDVFGWIYHTFPSVDLSAGPQETAVVTTWDDNYPYHPEQEWQLQGFSAQGGESFSLDPEDPRISATTSVANALLTTGANPGNVLQTITVFNDGDVPIALVDILDALSSTGLVVESITSGDVTVNAGFDGSIDPETLANGSIAVGGSATITVREAAAFGQLHTASVDANGTSPIGTSVFAAASTAFAVYEMEVKSGPLKTRKSGKSDKSKKVKVRVYGSENLDVRDIDWRSLDLEGASPLKVKVKSAKSKKSKRGSSYPSLEVDFLESTVIDGLLARLQAQTTALAPVSVTPTFRELTIPVARVAAALLDPRDRSISQEDRVELDRQGNANGQFDIGDLRARVLQNGSLDAVTAFGKKKKSEKSKKSGKSNKVALPTYTIVMTGSMNDGTPLFAEALIELDTRQEND